MYLDMLSTYTVFLLLLTPSILRKVLENVNGSMAKHPWIAITNDLNEDILGYYGLLQINPIIFDDN